MSQKNVKLEQERFADSVAELNERLARERDEESAFLLQNQDNEDFQGMSKRFFGDFIRHKVTFFDLKRLPCSKISLPRFHPLYPLLPDRLAS
jgi:hypothetical protein